MDGLTYREAYWHDAEARSAFQTFIQRIHSLDFSSWEAGGYWDDAYRPFTLFDGEGHVVSSVCVYSLDMVVAGRQCTAAQISGVGTDESQRHRGLNRHLTEKAMAWARDAHDFFFLFADEEALSFYEHCGFQPIVEHVPSVTCAAVARRLGARPLNMAVPEDRELVERLGRSRVPVSQRLGVKSTPLLMFHALYTLGDALMYIEALDAIAACRLQDDRITVFDVIARSMPSWAALAPYLVSEETQQASFYFCPDALDVQDILWKPYRDNCLHDFGAFPLRDETMLFPFTAHA